MQYNLAQTRLLYKKTRKNFCDIIGISEQTYSKFERSGEIPSKYLFILWEKLEDFPLPEDFFLYTSFTMQINMKYHNMTQTDIAKMFNISNQSTISGYMSQNIPMYEKKEIFEQFQPFVVPMIKEISDGKTELKNITELKPKGNFVLIKKEKEGEVQC